MTHLGPDKKGLGLDAPRRDEPSYQSAPADLRPRRWWLIGRSLVGATVSGVLWSVLAVVRLVDVLSNGSASGVDWLLVVVWGVMALGSVPSIVFFARGGAGRSWRP